LIFYRRKSGKIFFSIKDYGIGMSKEEISRIFDRFTADPKPAAM
jgi:signal transduction histidine kinase